MSESERAEAVEFLHEQAWELLAPGFMTYDQVIEALVELVVWDDDNPLGETDVRSAVDTLWHRRAKQLATSPAREPTDDVRFFMVRTPLVSPSRPPRCTSDTTPSAPLLTRPPMTQAAEAIAAEIVAALSAYGFTATWDGTATSRVQVIGLDRRRPLPRS